MYLKLNYSLKVIQYKYKFYLFWKAQIQILETTISKYFLIQIQMYFTPYLATVILTVHHRPSTKNDLKHYAVSCILVEFHSEKCQLYLVTNKCNVI